MVQFAMPGVVPDGEEIEMTIRQGHDVSDYIKSVDLTAELASTDVTRFGIAYGDHAAGFEAVWSNGDNRFDIEIESDQPHLRRGAKVVYRPVPGAEFVGVITGRYKRRNGHGVHAWGVFD